MRVIVVMFLLASVAGIEAGSTLKALTDHLALPESKRPPLIQQPFATVTLTKADAMQAQQLLWGNHLGKIRATRAAEMKGKVIGIDKLRMRFEFFVYGQKPKNGRSLFISMHGGGNVPARLNDNQWENQKRLYRPA